GVRRPGGRALPTLAFTALARLLIGWGPRLLTGPGRSRERGLLAVLPRGRALLALGTLLARLLLARIASTTLVLVPDPLANAVALRVDHFVELLGDIVQDGAEVITIEVAASGIAQTVQQLLDAHHAATAGELGPPLQHASKGAAQAPVVEHLVGDVFHHI